MSLVIPVVKGLIAEVEGSEEGGRGASQFRRLLKEQLSAYLSFCDDITDAIGQVCWASAYLDPGTRHLIDRDKAHHCVHELYRFLGLGGTTRQHPEPTTF